MPPFRQFSFKEQVEFVEVWQCSKSIAEVCRALGVSKTAAYFRSAKLRHRGVPLKWFKVLNPETDARCGLTRGEVEKLAELANRIATEVAA